MERSVEGTVQSDRHRTGLPGWQHQDCFTPLKEDWISHRMSETFPESSLNLQIVQKHFLSS